MVKVKVSEREREKDQKGIANERERSKGICNWMRQCFLASARRSRQKEADFTLLLISKRRRR